MSGGLVAQTAGADFVRWLQQFLMEHPEKGGPVEVEPEIETSDESDRDQTRSAIEIFVELQTGKRIRVSIGDGATASALYRKIASFIGRPRGSFALERFPEDQRSLPDIEEGVRVIEPWGPAGQT
jgi:hypothetical protein